MTADGIAGLLNSEFAEVEPKPDAAAEVPAAERGGEIEPAKTAEETAAAEAEAAEAAEAAAAAAEADPEAAAAAAEAERSAAEAAPPIPAELQTAIEDWEADGRGQLPHPLQALFDRKINKVVAQRKEQEGKAATAEARAVAAETRATALEAENTELKANPARPAPANTGALDEKQLAKQEQTAELFLGEASAFLDDSATEDERGRVERYMEEQHLDLPGLKRRAREIGNWLNRELPKQRQAVTVFRQQEQAAEPDVLKYFPWLNQKDTPEYKQAQEVLALMPELATRTPAHKIALGCYVLGLKQFQALQKGGKPAPVRTRAPAKTPVPGAAAPATAVRVNGKGRAEDAAREVFNQRVDRGSVEELLKAGLRA